MNYNAGARYQTPKGGSRKLSKRPTDVPGIEKTTVPAGGGNQMYSPPYNPYMNDPNQFNSMPPPSYNDNFQPQMQQPPHYASNSGYGAGGPNVVGFGGPGPGNIGFSIPGQQILSDPLVANVAMQYGSALVGTGRQIVDKEFEKYVPVTRLKYYFAVDTSYVMRKLKLLFFPFAHSDWSVKYEHNEPVQPRYEVNAPDLYIPTMAYVTYILVAGLVLGTQNRFSPEVLGIQASSALAWTVVEIIIELITLYITNIQTQLRTLDLLAFSGYKYVGMIFAVLISLLFEKTGYYVGLIYFSLALSFFLVRTLKWQVLAEVTAVGPETYNPSVSSTTAGNKRRLYFLLFVAGIQPFIMWFLSSHLVSASVIPAAAAAAPTL